MHTRTEMTGAEKHECTLAERKAVARTDKGGAYKETKSGVTSVRSMVWDGGFRGKTQGGRQAYAWSDGRHEARTRGNGHVRAHVAKEEETPEIG